MFERVGGIASVRCAKHTTSKLRNAARTWPPSEAHTITGRCVDAASGEMVRAPTSGQMRANKEGNAHTRAKYSMTAKKSTVETIRNNQAIRPSHNGIVIMQATQAQNVKQHKRDTANNASVILANAPSRHNGIVILRSRAQGFVTFRNISSAYLSYRLSLSIQTYYVTVEDWHKYRRTIVQAYCYAPMRIQRYCDMIICA